MAVIKDVLKAEILSINAKAAANPMSDEEYAELLASAISKQILSLTVTAVAPAGGGTCQVTIT